MNQWIQTRGQIAAQWAAEVAGMVTISAAAWMVWQPAALVIAGAYLVMLGNSGRRP
jgi:hypothetical protein